jgi:hypothetical protein
LLYCRKKESTNHERKEKTTGSTTVARKHDERLGGWTEDATAALYDHADRIPEIRAALESAK